MNPAYLPALAASAIGGLTSLASAWLTQQHQERIKRFSQEKTGRQKLYRQFIEEASKLYADALVQEQAEVSALVSVYALISRMRFLSLGSGRKGGGRHSHDSRHVLRTKQDIPELRKLMDSHAIDPLRAFSEECREELRGLQSGGRPLQTAATPK
jgi:hypothetical protein